jgi:hypothetical protein
MKNIFDKNTNSALGKITGPVAAVLLLSACAMSAPNELAEGIGFREARFDSIKAMRDYRNCRDDAIELDTKARKSGDTGRYIASARILEKCESSLDQQASEVGRDERIRSYALSIQNYLKGGDVEHARTNLESFKKVFPDVDLYYPNGSSFIETMEALLGQKDLQSFGQFAQMNVNSDLKDELRRIRHWK